MSETTTQQNSTATESKAATAKGAKAVNHAESAKALVASVLSAIDSIRDKIAKSDAGPLALREAAQAFGESVSDEGRPSVEAWQTLGLIASAVTPALRLRMEACDTARKAAFGKLRSKEKYAKDAKALDKALDRIAKVTGKSATHAVDANMAVKFGIPGKVAAMFE
jgi:hypothetical protein